MKKIIKFALILLLITFIPSIIFANSIEIYYKKQLIETMTISQFQALVKGADLYNEEIKAETNNRIKIFLEDDPWNLIQNGKYITYAYIYWYNENNEIIKSLKIQIKLKTSPDLPNNSIIDKILNIYKPISYYCFPFTVILNLILIGILAL